MRAVNSAGAGTAGPNAKPWYVAATTLPAAPASVTVTRSDGAITASWPAVTGADGYTVEYSAVGNGKWITAASNHDGTSFTIAGVNNGHTYLVGVSAEKRPDKGPPQVSPPAGPYSKQAPDAPPSVTILRADGKLTAFWNSGWGAESYEVAYTADGGQTWSQAAASHPVSNGITSIDISNLDNARTYTVRVRAQNKNGYSGWRNSAPSGPYVPINPPPRPKGLKFYASDQAVTFIWDQPVDLNNTQVTGYQAAYWLNPGNCAWPETVHWYNIYGSNGDTDYYTITGLTNGKKYGVALRAVNQGTPSLGAAGCRTPVAGVKPPPDVPPAPANLNLIRGDGTLTVTWYSSPTATGYQVNYSADGGNTWSIGSWWNRTTSVILRGMDEDTTYTVKVRGRSDRGDGPWTDSKTSAPLPRLTANSITDTGATLTLAHYTGGNWWYQADKAPDNSCKGPVSGTDKTLTGLSPGTAYKYTAYSDNGCSAVIETASFTTAVTVSNLGDTIDNSSHNIITSGKRWAAEFATGPNPAGYTVQSVTMPLQYGGVGSTPLQWTIRTSTTNSENKAVPSDTVQATLAGSTPTETSYSNFTHTCSDDCTLLPNTTYFLHVTGSGNSYQYWWNYTTSLDETAVPSDNGWSIGLGWYSERDDATDPWGAWKTWDDVGKFKVTAVPK